MDIKQRLIRWRDTPKAAVQAGEQSSDLARDALAEIERLEQSHGNPVNEARKVEALEEIADAFDRLARALERPIRVRAVRLRKVRRTRS
jgi:phage shock protein A